MLRSKRSDDSLLQGLLKAKLGMPATHILALRLRGRIRLGM